MVPLVFCENRNLGVLKQAFEEELGFAAPQVYRRQVRELVRLYHERWVRHEVAWSEWNSQEEDRFMSVT